MAETIRWRVRIINCGSKKGATMSMGERDPEKSTRPRTKWQILTKMVELEGLIALGRAGTKRTNKRKKALWRLRESYNRCGSFDVGGDMEGLM